MNKLTTVKVTLGIFGGIFDEQGKLLIKQREGYESLSGEWDLPGGGVELFAAEATLDERVLIEELNRELIEELGMNMHLSQRMPPMYPAMPMGGKDLALTTIIGVVTSRPTKGKWRYVLPRNWKKSLWVPKAIDWFRDTESGCTGSVYGCSLRGIVQIRNIVLRLEQCSKRFKKNLNASFLRNQIKRNFFCPILKILYQ